MSFCAKIPVVWLIVLIDVSFISSFYLKFFVLKIKTTRIQGFTVLKLIFPLHLLSPRNLTLKKKVWGLNSRKHSCFHIASQSTKSKGNIWSTGIPSFIFLIHWSVSWLMVSIIRNFQHLINLFVIFVMKRIRVAFITHINSFLTM